MAIYRNAIKQRKYIVFDILWSVVEDQEAIVAVEVHINTSKSWKPLHQRQDLKVVIPPVPTHIGGYIHIKLTTNPTTLFVMNLGIQKEYGL